MEHAVEIDAHHSRPLVYRVFPGGGVLAGDAGVVHQDVDPPERFHGVVARALHVGKLGHVARDYDDLAAVAEFLRGFVGERLVSIPDGDRGARVEEPFRDRAANPLALPRRQYRHIFYHAGGRSPLAELFHNEQRVGARDLAVRHRDQQPEARTLPDAREMFRGLLQRE